MKIHLHVFIEESFIDTAKSLQSCPTLCEPIDGSPPGSPIPGILQARILEWVAISFSNAWKWKVKVKLLSRVRLFETPLDCSPPGSSNHGIFQARVLEWVAIASSNIDTSLKVRTSFLSICVRIFLKQCFFVASFLYFQPKNQLKEQGQFCAWRLLSSPKTMRLRIMKKIGNRWELSFKKIQFTQFSHVQ